MSAINRTPPQGFKWRRAAGTELPHWYIGEPYDDNLTVVDVEDEGLGKVSLDLSNGSVIVTEDKHTVWGNASLSRDKNAHIAAVPVGFHMVEADRVPGTDRFVIKCGACGPTMPDTEHDEDEARSHATQHRINHVNALIEEMLDGVE